MNDRPYKVIWNVANEMWWVTDMRDSTVYAQDIFYTLSCAVIRCEERNSVENQK